MKLPRPLVGTDWLANHLSDGSLVIIDCRWDLTDPSAGAAAYREGHIAGARYASLDADLSAPTGPGRHPLPDTASWGRTLGRLGVSNDSAVVAYDDGAGAVAARLWWMLRWSGHEQVALLDGGLAAWQAEERLLSREVPDPGTGSYRVTRSSMPTMSRDVLKKRLEEVVVIDVRVGARYRGEQEPIDPIAGHIPTAVSAPFVENLDEYDRFKPPEVLRELFLRAGLSEGQDVVVYCGSGVTACHGILAMELAGFPTATLYPGSWSDWSNANDPVAVGPDPGSPPRSNPP